MAAAPSSARAATAVDVRDASRPPAGRRPLSAPRSVVLVVLLAAGVAWIVLLWGLSNHVFPGNSDDANALLAGRSIVHGNVLLAGWRLPSDPMVAIDIPLYGVFTLLIGVRPAVLHAVPVTLAVVAVGVACWVASLRVTNRLLAAAVAFILVVRPAGAVTSVPLQPPARRANTV